MRYYNHNLKRNSRRLRSTMTISERRLWTRVRRKQILDVQFYRQKPLGNYIVDFYAPRAGLVIEVDGAHHLEAEQAAKDTLRDAYMKAQGLLVLRFSNHQVLQQIDRVVETIYQTASQRLGDFQ